MACSLIYGTTFKWGSLPPYVADDWGNAASGARVGPVAAVEVVVWRMGMLFIWATGLWGVLGRVGIELTYWFEIVGCMTEKKNMVFESG